MLLLFFPSRRKVFSYSPELDLLSRTFFWEVFFSAKIPRKSRRTSQKAYSWKHGFVNQFTTSWKAFPLIWFFWNQSCVVCALQYTREIVFSWAGLVLWLLLTGNLLRDWNLMCSHFFPFFRWSLKLSPCTPPSLIYVFENTSAATWRQSSKKFSHFSQFLRASGILFPKFSSISA